MGKSKYKRDWHKYDENVITSSIYWKILVV